MEGSKGVSRGPSGSGSVGEALDEKDVRAQLLSECIRGGRGKEPGRWACGSNANREFVGRGGVHDGVGREREPNGPSVMARWILQTALLWRAMTRDFSLG